MTTTAAAWRHAHVWGSGECDGQSTDDQREPCGCAAPTPDHNGPCGWKDCTATGIHPRWLPHVPTRCTCGHPIVAALDASVG